MDPSLKLPEPPPALAELSERLCTKIVNAMNTDGRMGFERYMSMALYEPGLGYYVNGLYKFGSDGDFVTAPEQGSLFAYGLAQSLREASQALGSGWVLMEAGPGSGALAKDLLLQLEQPPARYLLLEPSAALRQQQAETLAALPDALKKRVEWINAPPEHAFDGVILANEVIDALPVARFEISDQGVQELGVTVDVTHGQGRFAWSAMAPSKRLQQAVDTLQDQLPEPLGTGYRSEICLDLPEWFKTITSPLRSGLVLMIDYGYPRAEYYRPERSDGTLVAHYRHRAHFDPFVWPGLTDLSAFVDFTALADAALGLEFEIAGFSSQAGFLLGSGVTQRLESCSDEHQRLRMAGELKRLVLPGEMGEKFKIMALSRSLNLDLQAFGFSDQSHRL